MKRVATMMILPAALLIGATPALADRAPSVDEAKAIAAKLQSLGYTTWEEIEYDDDGPVWEIDDARKTDGRRYDVKLSPNGLGVIKERLDD